MNILKEQLKKLIKIKTDQYFSDIKDTTAQADFIGHCIIKGYEARRKAEQKSKILAIEKKMLKDPDFPINKLIKKELKIQRDEIIEMLRKDGVGLKNGKKLTPSEIEDVIYAIKTMRIK